MWAKMIGIQEMHVAGFGCGLEQNVGYYILCEFEGWGR
jgi:hypothetical protein